MRSRRIVSWVVAILAAVVAEIGVFAGMPVALHFGPAGPLYVIPGGVRHDVPRRTVCGV
jgi:hypothetical protein